MLTETQFKILYMVIQKQDCKFTQRVLASETGYSLGKINEAIKELTEAGLLNNDMQISSAGYEAMESYKVKNAVIMAAGMSSRFVPLSYEKPKALLKVKGEVLIEREIKQLQEAGITDITVVVGYLKEQLFYLGDKYNVNIVINDDYYRYNNTSTLIRVADRLDNTYICSSDNYFTENPFEPYVYRAYYAAVYEAAKTNEYCISFNNKGRITKVNIGGQSSWYMLGHVYFDRDFSRKFVRILKNEYDDPLTKQQLWEDLYIRHIKELDLYIRKYDADKIKEFDSLEELREFDDKYLKNANSKIFTNICTALNVGEENITNVIPIKKGLTNFSFRFTVNGREYVYRHPGVGTSNFINRTSEKYSLEIAKKLGLDDTFICMDEKEGWKISYYIDDAETLDYHDREQVKEAIRMVRKLHTCNLKTDFTFDIWEEIRKFEERLEERGNNQFEDMHELHDIMKNLRCFIIREDNEKCLCHCDTYDPNFLVDASGKMYLIDWEYSGMAYRGGDIGTFIACSDYTREEADGIINMYLEHEADTKEKRYYYTYIAAAAYYWFLWAIYQNSVGNDVGEYLYIWYKYTKTYSREAKKYFEK